METENVKLDTRLTRMTEVENPYEKGLNPNLDITIFSKFVILVLFLRRFGANVVLPSINAILSKVLTYVTTQSQ